MCINGIHFLTHSGHLYAPIVDSDGDGIPDHLDNDDDGDGIPDDQEGEFFKDMNDEISSIKILLCSLQRPGRFRTTK